MLTDLSLLIDACRLEIYTCSKQGDYKGLLTTWRVAVAEEVCFGNKEDMISWSLFLFVCCFFVFGLVWFHLVCFSRISFYTGSGTSHKEVI